MTPEQVTTTSLTSDKISAADIKNSKHKMDNTETQALQITDELLAAFETETQKLLDNISIDHLKDKEAKLVYHYTDDKGLWGILSSGKFWINSVFNLNDPSEITHGVSIACQVFSHLAAQLSTLEVDFVEKFTSLTRQGLRDVAKFYALSFSFDYDDLAPWRSYANDGRGFALGLNKKKIESCIANLQGQTIGGFPIEYSTHKLQQLNTQLFNQIQPALVALQKMNLQQPLLTRVLVAFSARLAIRVIEASTHFKHEGYKSECEYRVLEVGSLSKQAKPPLHRLKNTEVVYYTELDWKNLIPDAIETITIGPGADQEKAMQYVKDCLRINQLPNVVVIDSSDIPYRPTRS